MTTENNQQNQTPNFSQPQPQPPEKKSKLKVVLIVIGVLIVLGIAGGAMGNGSGGNSSSTANSANTSAAQSTNSQSTDSKSTDTKSTETKKEKYTVTDEVADTSNMFSYKITGTLTNNTDKKVSYVQIQYVLKDANGAQVGTALANTNNLEAGGTWKFEAIGTVSPDKVASFERSDITGF